MPCRCPLCRIPIAFIVGRVVVRDNGRVCRRFALPPPLDPGDCERGMALTFAALIGAALRRGGPTR